MTHIYRAVIAATLSFAVSPAAAVTIDTSRTPVSARIAVHDLDLSSVAGRDVFAGRVRHAALRVCGQERGLRALRDMHRCRAEMARDAAVRLAALTPRRPIELAAVASR